MFALFPPQVSRFASIRIDNSTIEVCNDGHPVTQFLTPLHAYGFGRLVIEQGEFSHGKTIDTIFGNRATTKSRLIYLKDLLEVITMYEEYWGKEAQALLKK